MAKETGEKKDCCSKKGREVNGGGEAVYGFGLFGALFYYLSHAGSFGAVVLGIVKAFVWPAMLVYHLFTYLKL
jgi:hypothetical protein